MSDMGNSKINKDHLKMILKNIKDRGGRIRMAEALKMGINRPPRS